MDLYCPKCGEPWDNEEIHYLAEANGTTYANEAAAFRRDGCRVFGTACNPDNSAHPGIGALYDILGDDMDGAAAMFDDFSDLFEDNDYSDFDE